MTLILSRSLACGMDGATDKTSKVAIDVGKEVRSYPVKKDRGSVAPHLVQSAERDDYSNRLTIVGLKLDF